MSFTDVYCVLMIFSVASCIWLPMMDLSALFHNKIFLGLERMQHDLALEQMVLFPTRGQNTLDLLFTSHPTIIDKCKALRHWAEATMIPC
jgi:Zn-dependent protease with chaperone function